MADKRKAPMTGFDPEPKRPRVSREEDSDSGSVLTPAERPRNNPIFGQKSAFPGLDDGGEELTYEEPDGALEYLRMVRSEASALPSLFIAPASKQESKKPQQDIVTVAVVPGRQSFSLPAGFYEDEAFIAPANANKTTVASPEGAFSEAQNVCYDLLRHRFRLLRSTLRCTPPADAIAALDDFHPISLPRGHEAARKVWRRLILSVDPRMTQLACMDSHTVLGALGIVARELSDVVRHQNAENIRRMGAWIWGILGKCREVGELSTEDVGAIRDLGKRAAKICEKIGEENSHYSQDGCDSDAGEDNSTVKASLKGDSGHDEPQQAEVVGTGDSDMSGADKELDDLEAAKARLQAQLLGEDDTQPTGGADQEEEDYVLQLTRAMLDMILTIVGEFFGQRDLLEARQTWAN
ncbi:uncharacterized protein N7443_010232 [Penicillium atrosanguineum]|uniref:uncharacterized protein n=1 Tax=Penicillium atrosanguineum TaxID=1132637 RepID=UPI0023919B29|nr:uncharacterized protein N7443_010232 [Penicillium atrosanguineum]KAJ5289979.1 hypothetical protein N7443_010232 [Penicillium atrosanguineum]